MLCRDDGEPLFLTAWVFVHERKQFEATAAKSAAWRRAKALANACRQYSREPIASPLIRWTESTQHYREALTGYPA